MMKSIQLCLSRLREIFGLDLRSLALFRVSLGILLICDLINRGWYLVAHYTDFGVLPRHALLEYFANEWHISLHLANGTVGFQVLMFAIAFIFALMLLFGYKTRLATIVSWFLLISLQLRNPMVLQGGDNFFKMLLFWAMFLPLGAKFSIDAALRGVETKHDKPFLSMGSVGLYTQIMLVYWVAVLHKSGPEWWGEGTAVYYTLQIDQLARPFGLWLGQFAFFTTFFTRLVIFWQSIGPLLLLNPFWFGPIRMAVILIFIFMQFGFGSSFYLGLFPWIAAVAMFGFIPSWFWSELSQFRSQYRKKMKIYYDDDCGFCKKAVKIVTTFLVLPGVAVYPAQKDQEICSLMQKNNSWVVVGHNKEKFYGFNGFIEVFRASPVWFFLAPLLGFTPIRWLGNICYRIVAKRRTLHCSIAPVQLKPVLVKSSWIGNIVALFLIFYISAWNISNIKQQEGWFPEDLVWLGRLVSIDQEWSMFAPSPLKEDGWHVIPGKLLNGREVDLFTGKSDVSHAKPELVSLTYPSQRWRKYMMNITAKDNTDYRLYYGQHLCRKWNTSHVGDDRLDTFEVIFYMEKTLPDYKVAPVEKMILWKHHCFEK
ncbi:MAG: DCC1-like thiol-disulfide oxidoreductase family protein [Candidatus Gracilibacteria bacterium]|nr:DCC1-like thiol-disulfide oxidoreductase family protein [Candidatus Gracilibacteria bacterium]